ncbi:MAG: ribonuclease inhibitor [Methanosphaera sp. rholeuAM74]|nr:MAG: ribonuclease inhibitor [Methanosphaera sp. rholeuAM74]
MVFLTKVIILDGKLIKKRSHDYLSEVFDFPSYYGRNLDALYDCLTDIGTQTEIHLINSRYVSLDLIDTFIDASCSSSFITFIEE